MIKTNEVTMDQSQWKQLFAEQLSSGLSVREFCLSKDIKQKTFYTRRSAMGLSPHQSKPAVMSKTPSAFIKAELTAESFDKVDQVSSVNPSVLLTINNHLVLSVNESVSIQWLASLIKELTPC